MALLGIDIGSSHCVMATISKGTVQVVRNELSERQTPSIVSFTSEQRLIGDHAQAQIVSNYNNTCRNIKNYLGMFYESISQESSANYSLAKLQKAEYGLTGYLVQYQNKEELISATRVMASLLCHLVKIAKNFIGTEPTQLVISCPGWYTDIQRSALLSAVEIANLKCLRIISEHTATALDYGIYRMAHFSSTTPSYVAFVAMGHCNTTICVVKFTKERFKILSEVNDRLLGGKDMDELIVNYLANTFFSKTGLNALKSKKHKLKLEEQATKIKKILSANSEATCNLECFMEDCDINEIISRDLFVEMCSNQLLPHFQNMIDQAVTTSGISLDQISSVEMVGGCTRIPWVINAISKYFGYEPSRTLSADECVARGCALQAAMLSVHYKVIDYGCHEILNHPISLDWCSLEKIPEQFQNNPFEAFPPANFQKTPLMQKGMGTNKKQKITIDAKGPLLVRACYTSPEQLPIGTSFYLGMCLVTPSHAPLPITIDISINLNGQFKFTSAYTMKKVESPVRLPPLVNNAESSPENSEQLPSPDDPDTPQKSEDTDSENNEKKSNGTSEKDKQTPETQPNLSPKYTKQILSMVVKTYLGSYSKDMIDKFKSAETEMAQNDAICEMRSAKLNELESSIYNFRNGLKAELAQFSTTFEKEDIGQTLMKIEDWIYDNYDADLEMINKVFDEFKQSSKVVYQRAETFKKIREGIDQLLYISEMCEKCAIDANGTYSNHPPDEKQKLRQATTQTNYLVPLALGLDPINPDQSVLKQLKSHYDFTSDLYNKFVNTNYSNDQETSTIKETEQNGSSPTKSKSAEKSYSDSN